ncbi:MAG: hypothetical protein BMS9Abin23_0258 [Thermodesulfobacteriota bacterium]|nr:MAG: hypothetical protein BMS9Abin23_0258 [Thermodesulfobacteriota bacterium]
MKIKKAKSLIFMAAAIVSITVIFSVAWHSLDEIHYLKTFYPREFSVEEAFYASAVELVKVLVISIPFIVLLAASLYLLTKKRRKE